MKLSSLLIVAFAILTSGAPLSTGSDLSKRACFFDRKTGAYTCTGADSKAIPTTPVIPRQCIADPTTGDELCSTNNIEVESDGTVINPKRRSEEPAQPATSFKVRVRPRVEKRQCFATPTGESCPPCPSPVEICWTDENGEKGCEIGC